jgi:starch synthase
MRIVFLAPEMSPLAKVGGLADVVGSLPGALRARGHEVSVVLPAYAGALESGYSFEGLHRELSVPLGGEVVRGSILRGEMGGVPVYLLDQPSLFHRPGIYGEGGTDYSDNAERFGWFCAASLEALRLLDLRPEVLHLHDWQTSLAAVLLREAARAVRRRPRPGLFLTIHNLAYQGRFDPALLEALGLPETLFHPEALEFYGLVNLLKGGIVFSDLVSTVSPTYAAEIQTTEHGHGLEGVLSARSKELHGVLNGIAPEMWDPSTDPALPASFSPEQPEGKRRCKDHLQRRLGLERRRGRVLCGAVGRFDPQKGFDLIASVAPELVRRGLQLAFLGAGHPWVAEELRRLAVAHPGAVSVTEGFDESLARRIYAGSDLFLMPSRYEPCGLGQMIALRYGALPVVHRTGGLADSIVDLLEDEEAGNGFVFDCEKPRALLQATLRGAEAWRSAPRRRKLVHRAMSCDFSWESSARTYESLYRETARMAAAASAKPREKGTGA